MSNCHTKNVCRVYLVTTIVLVPHGQLVKFSDDVIGGASIYIPVCIDVIGVGDSVSPLLLMVIVFIAPPTSTSATWMMFEADLTLGVIIVLLLLLLLLLPLL